MKTRSLIFTSLLLSASLFADEFVINLKDPKAHRGIVKTEHGGVICAPCLRIQAQKITYINKEIDGEYVQKIIAECDLMMEYQGRIFVGDKLEFDMLNKTGYLQNGRTGIASWFLGGDLIELYPDGTLSVEGSHLTLSPSLGRPWEVSAEKATLSERDTLHARDVRLEIFGLPIFWVPSYKTNLQRFRDSPFQYKFRYDRKLGPLIWVGYRFLSTDTWKALARFTYRIKRGPGGALEVSYISRNKRTEFQSNNYGALDKIFPDEKGDTRFRFQGLLKTKSESENTRFHMQWDRLSDDRMVSDFRDTEFNVSKIKESYLEFAHYKENAFFELTVRPRLNDFQSLSQELPSTVYSFRPFEIWNSGIISENYLSGSYLDYTFANRLDKELSDRKSARVETLNTLYRPFSFSGINITPRAGLVGIYYSKSPDRQATGQLLYTYGGDANVRISGDFDRVKHTIEPYAQYLGYTQPQTAVDDYYVFSILDGYDRLDELRFGLRQLFFSKQNPIFLPAFVLDIYSYAFWGARSFDNRLPKVFLDMTINQPSWSLDGETAWNIQENVLEYGNARFLWTVSAQLALGVEYRYRSEFWWRKAIHHNFVVDFARPLDELLISPLSDKRDTVLFKAHLRLTNRWNMNLYTFHGFGRDDEPNYNGARVDFYTMLISSRQFQVTYEYSPNDPIRFTFHLNKIL